MEHGASPLPLAGDEQDRLATLAGFAILDTPAEREFDDVARLAATALGVASAAVCLIDADRQWFKARHGISFTETPREIAFCTHAVTSQSILVVPNATLDKRFSANPLVTQEGGIRFYAGVPLITSSGHCLGTLCVFDPLPRQGLMPEQEAVLRDLSRLAVDLIESRRYRRMGEIAAKVVDATSDAIIAVDRQGDIIYWNSAAERMFGRPAGEALGENVEIIIPARLAADHREVFARAAAGGATHFVGNFVEMIGVRGGGSEFPVELLLAQWGETETEGGFVAIVRDITARRSLERDRARTQAFLDTVVTNLPAMLFVKDSESRQYIMVNRAAEDVIGRNANDLVGATDRDLFPGYGEAYEQRDTEAIAAGKPHVFESAFVRDDGVTVHLRTTRSLVDGPDRSNQYILGVAENVTETRRAEAEILRLAHYDPLTGLLNRASYTDRLHRLVQDAGPFAILSIDLDRFKAVNDQFGHPVGDAVLAQVAYRLRGSIQPTDWVARVGGDEFMVILTGKRLRQRARTLAETIIGRVAEPVVTDRAVAHLGASVGIVVVPDDGTTTAQVRENADLALYRAKRQGKGTMCFFNADMDAAARDRQKLEKDLRAAIEADEITLAYQPVLLAQTGQITSAEALARWTHPARGPIRPDLFISLAEESGLIDRLGEQLLHRACTDAQRWPAHVRVAVNLSPLQFISGGLLQIIRSALDHSGLRADRLQIEVTENLVIRDVNRTFEQLERLRALGIQVLMDDFGVGYSSLSYFQRFPFDKVKLDKSFVDTVTTSHASRAIIQSVVGLGNQLGMGVVAEGIETEEQMRLLVECGCTHLQGYLFSRPLHLRALQGLLQNEKSAARPNEMIAA
ncbi:EAL domain-containing protein [Sphingobium sp.]|uniref:sensor domain-containing phosphodiesterase n=1 Tax=Sphingobium sp. TaxID=1912891 RepID=UPI000DB33D2D|nr:EAL domain-containing protein [Sphingobium sp.]PZU69499.1 MAG: bifunctional diguanylate cyclase/phosphodiesterase [Sphingobium sp.]